jgi:outer membrane protein assembly factor BamB
VSAPAPIAAKTVVIGSDDQTVYGLDAVTGEQRWSYRPGVPWRRRSRLTRMALAYVASRDGSLAAIPASEL